MSAENEVRGARDKRALRLPSWHMVLAGAGLLFFVPAIAWVGQVAGHDEHTYTEGDSVHSSSDAVSVVSPERLSPGVPLVSRIEQSASSVSVVVSPMRPGWNLVRVEQTASGASDGEGSHASEQAKGHETSEADSLRVGTDESELVKAERRPGATGRWARVWLPRGESELLVGNGTEHVVPISVDTGNGETAPTVATGSNGPECASAAVGALLGGGEQPLPSCPAERLTDSDADRLRAAVRFLADRGLPGISLVHDDSTRSLAAAHVVRRTAEAHGLAVDNDPAWAAPDQALLVLTGWAPAAQQLEALAEQQSRGEVVFTGGTYLAPWLLNPSLLASVPNALLPLSFDIRESEAVQFSAALRTVIPGEQPTAAGYQAWQSTQRRVGTSTDDDVRLYASSRVAIMPSQPGHGPHERGVSWLPGGTITPVTNALPTH